MSQFDQFKKSYVPVHYSTVTKQQSSWPSQTSVEKPQFIAVSKAHFFFFFACLLLEDLHVPMQGGGVPATVHIQVHLLGDLLRVSEVRRRHRHPDEKMTAESTTVQVFLCGRLFCLN